eukprot:m.91489 g.91489  ORF g.91489 m.91489 type:complete len:506 (+) comp36697_c0_seq8:44-1561(+)
MGDRSRSARRHPRVRKELSWSHTFPDRGSGILHSTPNKSDKRYLSGRTAMEEFDSKPFETTLLSSIDPDDDTAVATPFVGEEKDISLSSQLGTLADALHVSRKGGEEMRLIYKQQDEMRLLMTELRDRDRELNEMVSAHRKQLSAWEVDRQKILLLEERYAKLKKELHGKEGHISYLESRVKEYDNLNETRSDELETTQVELKEANLKVGQSVKEFKKVKVQQHSLQKSLKILKEREENLSEELAVKTVELKDKIQLLSRVEKNCQELKQQLHAKEKTEVVLSEELAVQKQLTAEAKAECKETAVQSGAYQSELSKLKSEISAMQQKSAILEKELQLSVERDKRKDQLIDLQRAKQQRFDAELSNSRQLYERQMREMEMLQLNLHSSQEELIKQEQELSLHRHSLSKGKDYSTHLIHNGSQKALSPLHGELGQLASDIKLKLTDIWKENEDSSDSEDDVTSVASYSTLPGSGGPTLNTSGRLEKLLIESHKLAKDISRAKATQAE